MGDQSSEVRASCRAMVARSRYVRLDRDALAQIEGGTPPALSPEVHLVEADPADVAAYVLALDAINFGSAWFAEVEGLDYEAVAGGLRARFLADGPWSPAQLRAVTAAEVAATITPLAAGHALTVLFVRALRELGRALGDRSALQVVRGREPHGQRLVAWLGALPGWRDPGFRKRAQIAVNDLALAGVATWSDRAALTAFADNALPAVLRREGVLRVDDAVAARIDAGLELPRGRAERELRAASVVACEELARRLGVPDHEVDVLLWHRAVEAPPDGVRLHRTRTVWY